jgi:hypothetical protein
MPQCAPRAAMPRIGRYVIDELRPDAAAAGQQRAACWNPTRVVQPSYSRPGDG